MSKRRLFIAEDNSPTLNSSGVLEMSPHRGGIHPAFLNSKEGETGPHNNIEGAKSPPKAADDAMEDEPNSDAKSSTTDISFASDLDLEPMDVPGFFSKSNQKLPYTREEDEIILKYVLKGENVYKVSSISLWKQLEAKKDNPKRTYQSLKNRFLRNIKPCLFSKFGHFVKDKSTIKKIVTKFPELKQQVGRRETLPNMKLPERKSAPKTVEEDKVSSTCPNEAQGNSGRGQIPQLPEHSESIIVAHPKIPEVQPQTVSKESNPNSFKTEVYERIVNEESDGITVLINFTKKTLVDIPTGGIYEKFRKLKQKYKSVHCPTCGRSNLSNNDSPPNSHKESDIFISNSVGSQNHLKINGYKSKGSSEQKGTKISGSDLSKCSPSSPSLLTQAGDTNKIDKPQKKSPGNTNQVTEVSALPNSTSSKTNNGNTPSLITPEEEIPRRTTRSQNTGKSSQKPIPSTSKAKNTSSGKRYRDKEEDSDSVCEEAMANFRKIITTEEEEMLGRKCLKKKLKDIGLQGIADVDLEACFFDSSSDLGTPPLTIDYETDSQNTKNDTEFESLSSSSLAQNMKKMIEPKKGKNKNS